MNQFNHIKQYMVGRKGLYFTSLILSALHGLTALVPFVFIWLVVQQVLMPQHIIDYTKVEYYAWWALTFTILSIVIYFIAILCSHLVAFRVEINMRKKGMKRLMEMPIGYFSHKQSGNIRKVLDEDTSQTHTFLAHVLPDLAGSLMAPIGIIVLMFTIDWRFGLVALIPIFIAFTILGVMMNPKKNQWQTLYLDAQERMSGEAVEYVRGIPVVKVFQQTVFSFKRFHQSIIDYRDLAKKYVLAWKIPFSAYQAVINGFALVLIPAAILFIGWGMPKQIVVANMLLYLIIAPLLASNIMKVMYTNEGFVLVDQALTRLEKLTDSTPLPQPLQASIPTNYSVTFNNVSFAYEGSHGDTIHNISFTIPEGKTYALVGPSGGGKSTIAKLIPRFYDVSKGSVTIGGINVKDIDKRILMNITAFVFQQSSLFAKTIRENITYGSPNVSNEAINRAIELSQSSQIINHLPQGLNTIIGKDGTYLSGGEQQRIILARTILKNAPITVFDEATAFADPENEALIHKALFELRKGKTTLMVAHRLSSVKDVDCIIVIDNGTIAEQGSHNELITKGGIYCKMWNDYQQAVQWTL